jgi:hypothetical protein
MPGQVATGDFASGPRAESTESAESFQPHFLGEEQISTTSVTAIAPVPEPKRLKLSALSAHSAAPPDAQSIAS